MAIAYSVDSATAHVRLVGTGVVTMSMVVSTFDQIATDPAFRPHFTVLIDNRQSSYTAELQDGDELVLALKRRRDDFPSPVALLVPKSLHVLARLYCLLIETSGIHTVRCFTDMAEALQWCGVAE